MSNKKNGGVRFIRKNGRVIPVRDNRNRDAAIGGVAGAGIIAAARPTTRSMKVGSGTATVSKIPFSKKQTFHFTPRGSERATGYGVMNFGENARMDMIISVKKGSGKGVAKAMASVSREKGFKEIASIPVSEDAFKFFRKGTRFEKFSSEGFEAVNRGDARTIIRKYGSGNRKAGVFAFSPIPKHVGKPNWLPMSRGRKALVAAGAAVIATSVLSLFRRKRK